MPKKASLQRDAFLFCVSQTGNITVAVDFIGMRRADILAEMAQDAVFAQQIEAAKQESYERLLYHAYQRALHGVQVPHFYQGELIGHSARPSDSLLCYLLKHNESAYHQEDGQEPHINGDLEQIRLALKKRLAVTPVLPSTPARSETLPDE